MQLTDLCCEKNEYLYMLVKLVLQILASISRDSSVGSIVVVPFLQNYYESSVSQLLNRDSSYPNQHLLIQKNRRK